MNNNNYKVTEDVWKLSSVTYNGKSSEELGLFIQAPPTYEYPERDVTVTHIPGRNGDLIVDNGCYKNVTRTYMLAKNFQNGYKFAVNAESVLSWLTSAKGKYVELTDDYESDVYMMATYIDRGNFTNYYNKALSIAVQFQCKPQKYLNSGKITAEFSFEDQEEDLYRITSKIRNSYNYEALPLVTICWDQTELDNDQIVMLSVTNIQGDTTSSICISSINQGDLLSIDSELQTCYNQNGDANDTISLNGGKFPYLDKGSNKVSLTQYIKDNTEVIQYSKLISDEQIICESKYASKDILIAEKQDKAFVKSFKTLIETKSVIYDAASYESMLYDISETYVVLSYNTLLNNSTLSVTINTDWKYIATSGNMFQDWLKGTQTDDNIELRAGKNGFFMTSESNSKNIKYYASNDVITTVKSTKTTTIYYYPCKMVSNLPVLDVEYVDLPNWLEFEIDYKDVDGKRSPSEIRYVATAVNNPGWYMIDQGSSGILSNISNFLSGGKSKWSKYQQENVVLNTLTWQPYKKAFMLTSNPLSTATSVDITYKYAKMDVVNGVPQEIQYPTENNIEPTFIVNTAQINNKGVMEITLFTKNKADTHNWYAYILAGSDLSAWRDYTGASAQLVTLKGTEDFSIYYLENVPTYENEDLWPDWLDPVAYAKSNGVYVEANPNSSRLFFKTKTGISSAWYNYSINTENTEYTEFEQKAAGVVINDKDPYDNGLSSEESFYIDRLEENPASLNFNNDRSYSIDGGEPTSTPPDWLSATYDLEENTVSFKAESDGYFKWDNNGSWVYHTSTGESADLITINNDTNIVFYYMNELPEYDSFDYVTVEHTETGDNPTGINIYAKVEGYFRVLGTADWKYYKPNDLIVSTTINQEINILYLVENTSADLHNVKIRIKPRWWKL